MTSSRDAFIQVAENGLEESGKWMRRARHLKIFCQVMTGCTVFLSIVFAWSGKGILAGLFIVASAMWVVMIVVYVNQQIEWEMRAKGWLYIIRMLTERHDDGEEIS